MKYLVFSDIHGSIESTQFLIKKFEEEKCDKMICLGDVLYHGPRNDVPENYNPKKVIELLNQYAPKILGIQGNCDAEVDQMVLNFQLKKTDNIYINGISLHLEHGHHLETLSSHAQIVLFGHIHIPLIEEMEHQLFVNPGSITIPKNNSPRSYIIMDDEVITIYSMNGEVIKKHSIK